MNLIQAKKDLVKAYFSEALRLRTTNGNVDDYDICRSTGENFEPIANLKLPILSLLEYLIAEYEPQAAKIVGESIALFDDMGTEIYRFSFILTPMLSFSGTVGINAVEYDGGLYKHLDYLSLFFPHEAESFRGYCFTNTTDENALLEEYVEFYRLFCEKIQNNPMALYNLLTGIKKHYNLLDHAVLLETADFSMIDFTKLKSPDFINNFSDVDIEVSDTSPMLKISYQASKLLHLRTKSEKKNSAFKLRFFIETSSKFLNLFKQE